jgi:hypothetical protein
MVGVATGVMLALVVLQSYRFVPVAFHTLAQLALLAAQTVIISLAFVGWGGVVLRLLGARLPSSPAAAWASGAILSSTLAAWLAQIRFPDIWLWAPWLLAGVLLAWWNRHLIGWRRAFPAHGLLLFAAPFALAGLTLALAPPVSLDALVYHLSLPKQFALAERMFSMPWNLHASFPLHAEMLYGLALTLDATGRLAQLLHLTAALATLSVVLDLGRRLDGVETGVWAAVLLYTMPVLALTSGWAWSDWFVLLYAALAFEALLAVRDGEEGAALPMLWFVVAAPAVKYNALPLLALPAMAPRALRPRRLVAGAGIAFALLAPWYGRNLLLYGNPIYPLLSGSSRVGPLVGFRGAETGFEKWLGYLGRADLLDESLGVLLIAGLVLGIGYSVRHWSRAWPLATVIGLYLAVGAIHHPTVRAFTPLLLAAALLVGGGLARLWQRTPRAWVIAAVGLLLWVNLAQVLWIVREHQPSGVAFGYQKAETYLQQQLDVYPAQSWINQNTPSGAGVLVVGDSRIFHLDRPAIAASFLDPHPLTGFLRPGENLPALVTRLQEAGIDYILFNSPHYRVGEKRQLRNELIFYGDPQADSVFRYLLAMSGEPIFAERGVGVWRLGEAAGGAPAP